MKADPTRAELQGLTAFEHAFKAAMFAPEVRIHLQFQQGSGNSSSSNATSPVQPVSASGTKALAKLQNKVAGMEKERDNLKRKLGEAGAGGWQPKGNGKGKKGKDPRGSRRNNTPKEWNGLSGTAPGGGRICYGWNLSRGCPLAKAGESCQNGLHICPQCPTAKPPHSLMTCPVFNGISA